MNYRLNSYNWRISSWRAREIRNLVCIYTIYCPLLSHCLVLNLTFMLRFLLNHNLYMYKFLFQILSGICKLIFNQNYQAQLTEKWWVQLKRAGGRLRTDPVRRAPKRKNCGREITKKLSKILEKNGTWGQVVIWLWFLDSASRSRGVVVVAVVGVSNIFLKGHPFFFSV